jgi:hypothetical protein
MLSIVRRINPTVKISLYEKCFIANNIGGEQKTNRGLTMTKKTKKDGGTKQKGKGSKGNKTLGSANGTNGYH